MIIQERYIEREIERESETERERVRRGGEAYTYREREREKRTNVHIFFRTVAIFLDAAVLPFSGVGVLP